MTPKYKFTPELLDALPEELAELFRGLELTLLKIIVERIKKAGQINQVGVEAIKALRANGITLGEIKQAVADTVAIGAEKLDALLDDVVEWNRKYYRDMVTLAKVTEPERYVDERDIAAIRRQTWGAYRNITGSMGFLVVQKGRLRMLEPAAAYQHALDSALLQVESGAVSYETAIADAVRKLAESGLKSIDFESGAHRQLDSHIRTCVMTGVNQLNSQYREQSMDYLETDLLEISAHLGARNIPGPNGWEDHESWQGLVVRWDAKPLTSKGEYPDFVKTCGYGSVTGILGVNCRHSYFPFLEGISIPTHTKDELEGMKSKNRPKTKFDGKEYDTYQATQMQRTIERNIRYWKRREMGEMDADKKTAITARLRRLHKKYKEFSKAAGLPEQRERMQVLYK